MAEAIPFGVAASVATKLGSAAFQQLWLVYGVKEDMKKLERTLSTINAVLLDVEKKQDKSHAVRNWTKRLQEIIYDADDLLDDFGTEELRRKVDGHGRLTGQVVDFFSPSNRIAFHGKMSRRVKEIRQRFDEVSMDALKFNFLERGLFNTKAESSKREMTTSFVLQSKIIGREDQKNEVIELLLQPHDRENISVVAIVGFGGLGKTTLTQLVYNDERVKNSFDKTFWVCVSREFDVQAIVKKMLASIIQKEVDSSDSEELHSQLLKNLQGKRFLLVLDDLWNENDRDWSNLKTFLLAGAQGSGFW